MLIYIGIDDTDDINTGGTGLLACQLGTRLVQMGWGEITEITRHQLFAHKDIPYSSSNSALCIGLKAAKQDFSELIATCGEFLYFESAAGSDPGLCIAQADTVTSPAVEFGRQAKQKVLKKDDAISISQKCSIHLAAYGGTGQGIIGALAAVGLRVSGQDGSLVRFEGNGNKIVGAGEMFPADLRKVLRAQSTRRIPARNKLFV